MSERQIAVAVSGVSRMFKRYRHPRHRVMEALGLPLPKNAYDEFWALRDIAFEVKRGDSLAIIGQNGAGKSTLLSIICGRLQPSSGSVTVRGEIQALMDLGTGFHPEFTGAQNVYSALAYQGITGAQADRRYGEIVEFSELEEFIDQPIKTYSTGMYARLAFSTATAIEPDVLVIDEILSAGDAYFASKCTDRMRRLTREIGATVLFVSHDISSVQRLCDRAVWLERGRIKMAGPTLDISKAYYASVTEREEARLRAQTTRAVARMRRRGAPANSAGEEDTLLLRLVMADGGLPAQSHPVCRVALVLADGQRLEVLPGEPMDNDESQAAYIRSDPGYMLWDLPATVAGRASRCVSDTGGSYRHAPIFFRASMDMLGPQAAIEIEHAAVPGEAIAVEIHEPGGYRRLGVLTPSQARYAWRVDRLQIAGPAAITDPGNGFDGCSIEDEKQRGDCALGKESSGLEIAGNGRPREKWETGEARFLDICTADASGATGQSVFKLGEPITFKINVALHVFVPVCWLAGIIFDAQGNRVFLGVHKFENGLDVGESEILFRLGSPNLRQGEYVGSFELLPIFDYYWPHSRRIPYLCHWDRCVYFKIEEDYRGSIALGLVFLPVEVTTQRLSERHDRRPGSGVPVLAEGQHEPGAG
jgi:lipopolysaccharide transport system ATP-binding protein